MVLQVLNARLGLVLHFSSWLCCFSVTNRRLTRLAAAATRPVRHGRQMCKYSHVECKNACTAG